MAVIRRVKEANSTLHTAANEPKIERSNLATKVGNRAEDELAKRRVDVKIVLPLQ